MTSLNSTKSTLLKDTVLTSQEILEGPADDDLHAEGYSY